MGIWSLRRVEETIRNMGIPGEREINNLAIWIWEEGMCIPQSKEVSLRSEEEKKIKAILKRIGNREPVQYIVGHAWFYGIKLKVTPDVLIPRPETEELVNWVITDYKKATKPLRILDIGTGSGCIAIAIKKHLGDGASVTAIDVSSKALKVAEENARSNNISLSFVEHDFLKNALDDLGVFDIIVSNPPYIVNSGITENFLKNLAHEPSLALYPPGENPEIFYEKMSLELPPHLSTDGFAYLEINEFRAAEVINIFKAQNWGHIEVENDMQGLPRMLKVGLHPC